MLYTFSEIFTIYSVRLLWNICYICCRLFMRCLLYRMQAYSFFLFTVLLSLVHKNKNSLYPCDKKKHKKKPHLLLYAPNMLHNIKRLTHKFCVCIFLFQSCMISILVLLILNTFDKCQMTIFVQIQYLHNRWWLHDYVCCFLFRSHAFFVCSTHCSYCCVYMLHALKGLL